MMEIIVGAVLGVIIGYSTYRLAVHRTWAETRSRLKTAILDEELVPMSELSGSMLDRMTSDIMRGNKVRKWN